MSLRFFFVFTISILFFNIISADDNYRIENENEEINNDNNNEIDCHSYFSNFQSNHNNTLIHINCHLNRNNHNNINTLFGPSNRNNNISPLRPFSILTLEENSENNNNENKKENFFQTIKKMPLSFFKNIFYNRIISVSFLVPKNNNKSEKSLLNEGKMKLVQITTFLPIYKKKKENENNNNNFLWCDENSISTILEKSIDWEYNHNKNNNENENNYFNDDENNYNNNKLFSFQKVNSFFRLVKLSFQFIPYLNSFFQNNNQNKNNNPYKNYLAHVHLELGEIQNINKNYKNEMFYFHHAVFSENVFYQFLLTALHLPYILGWKLSDSFYFLEKKIMKNENYNKEYYFYWTTKMNANQPLCLSIKNINYKNNHHHLKIKMQETLEFDWWWCSAFCTTIILFYISVKYIFTAEKENKNKIYKILEFFSIGVFGIFILLFLLLNYFVFEAQKKVKQFGVPLLLFVLYYFSSEVENFLSNWQNYYHTHFIVENNNNNENNNKNEFFLFSENGIIFFFVVSIFIIFSNMMIRCFVSSTVLHVGMKSSFFLILIFFMTFSFFLNREATVCVGALVGMISLLLPKTKNNNHYDKNMFKNYQNNNNFSYFDEEYNTPKEHFPDYVYHHNHNSRYYSVEHQQYAQNKNHNHNNNNNNEYYTQQALKQLAETIRQNPEKYLHKLTNPSQVGRWAGVGEEEE